MITNWNEWKGHMNKAIKELSFRWTILNTHIAILRDDIKTARLIRKHCNKGHHRMTDEHLKVTTQRAKHRRYTLIDVEWLRCVDCNMEQFTNRKDMNKYINFKTKEARDHKAAVKKLIEAKVKKELANKQEQGYFKALKELSKGKAPKFTSGVIGDIV